MHRVGLFVTVTMVVILISVPTASVCYAKTLVDFAQINTGERLRIIVVGRREPICQVVRLIHQNDQTCDTNSITTAVAYQAYRPTALSL